MTDPQPQGAPEPSESADVPVPTAEPGRAVEAPAPERPSTSSEEPPPKGPRKTRPATLDEAHLRSVLEALLFASGDPVGVARLARITGAEGPAVRAALQALAAEYEERGVRLVEVAGGWQFRTAAAHAPFVRELVGRKPPRLTRAQMETLAIVAYRQPITKPEIEEVRGVDCGSALRVLLEREMLRVLGRKEEPGRPLLYGTTPRFLEMFGLRSLRELPTLREFTELTDESRRLFEKRLGEPFDLRAGMEEALARAAERAEAEAAREDEAEDDPADEAERTETVAEQGAASEASSSEPEDQE